MTQREYSSQKQQEERAFIDQEVHKIIICASYTQRQIKHFWRAKLFRTKITQNQQFFARNIHPDRVRKAPSKIPTLNPYSTPIFAHSKALKIEVHIKRNTRLEKRTQNRLETAKKPPMQPSNQRL